MPPQQGRRHDLPPYARANDHEPPHGQHLGEAVVVLACSLSSVLLPAATADPGVGGTISPPVAAALALPPLGLTGSPARPHRCAISMPSPPLPLGEAPRLATGPAPTRIRELAPTDLAVT